MAIKRKPKAKAPGVFSLANGTQKCSTRARSRRTPSCLRRYVQAARVGSASGSSWASQRSALLSLRKTAPKLWPTYRCQQMSTQTTSTSVSLRTRVVGPQMLSVSCSMRWRG
jgi:hypothetical protein